MFLNVEHGPLVKAGIAADGFPSGPDEPANRRRACRKLAGAVLGVLLPGALGIPLAYSQNTALQLKVIKGGNSFNNLNGRAADSIVVRLTDATGKPVSRAGILVRAPESSPTLRFGGQTSANATTDISGEAVLPPGMPEGVGLLSLEIIAASGSDTTSVRIKQRNYRAFVDTAGGGGGAVTPANPIRIEQVSDPEFPRGRKESRVFTIRVVFTEKGADQGEGGANVTFKIVPSAAASASFGFDQVDSVTSIKGGYANSSKPITTNGNAGQFTVHVTASARGFTKTIDLSQTIR